MDQETLNRVMVDLKDLKEVIFLLWLKIEKSKQLSISEQMYLEERIKMMLQDLAETEYRIFKEINKDKENRENIDTISDRGIIITHDLIDTLETIIDVSTLWDIHHYIVEISNELIKKGVQ